MTKQISVKEQKRLVKLFSTPGFKNRFKAIVKFVIPFSKQLNIEIKLGGGSYTDGKRLVVGLPEQFFASPMAHQIMALKALSGHEAEHVVSSDFQVFRQFQEDVYTFFKNNYGLENGRQIGAQLLNCTEDGRIEKRLVNRLKGMLKYIQFLNGVFYEASPVKGENQLSEYTLNVCYMAVGGVWMKDFDKVYGGTQMEAELEKVKPLIIKAINEPTAKGCADRTMDIIKANADFLSELLTPQPNQQQQQQQNGQGQSGQGGDPTDQLDRTNAEYTTSPSQGNGQPMELTESSHFVPEEENQQPSPSQQSQPKPESDTPDDESDDAQSSQAKGGASDSDEGEDDADENEQADGSSDSEDSSEEDDAKGSSAQEDADDSDSDTTDDADASDSNGQDEQQDSNQENNDSDTDASSDKDGGSEGNSEQQPPAPNDGTDPSNGNDTGETDSPKAEDEGKTVDELIKEMVEVAEKELEADNENAARQSIRENDQIAKEEARKEKERAKTTLNQKEKAAILKTKGGMRSLKMAYETRHNDISENIQGDLKRKGFKFRKDVENIFLDKKGFTRKNRRHGMLDTNALWRMTSGDTDVFIQKGNPKESDYAVSILLDNSGSMSEDVYDESNNRWYPKAEFAKRACVILEEGLKGVLPLQITQFEYSNNTVDHVVIRGFEAQDDTNYSWTRMNPHYTGRGNADGYSIKIAHRELMKRPEHKKVLFVLSDGEPSGYSTYSQAHQHVREAVDLARKEGVIVIAIRFGSPEFLEETADVYKEMYVHSYIACEPAQIQKELVKTLKKTIN